MICILPADLVASPKTVVHRSCHPFVSLVPSRDQQSWELDLGTVAREPLLRHSWLRFGRGPWVPIAGLVWAFVYMAVDTFSYSTTAHPAFALFIILFSVLLTAFGATSFDRTILRVLFRHFEVIFVVFSLSLFVIASSLAKDGGGEPRWATASSGILIFIQCFFCLLFDASRLNRARKATALVLAQANLVRILLIEALAPRMTSSAVVCTYVCSRLAPVALGALLNVLLFMAKQTVFTLLTKNTSVINVVPRITSHAELSGSKPVVADHELPTIGDHEPLPAAEESVTELHGWLRPDRSSAASVLDEPVRLTGADPEDRGLMIRKQAQTDMETNPRTPQSSSQVNVLH
jgi:hypothetical protein